MIHRPSVQQKRVAQLPEQTDFCRCSTKAATPWAGRSITTPALLMHGWVVLVPLTPCRNPCNDNERRGGATAAGDRAVGFEASCVWTWTSNQACKNSNKKKLMVMFCARTYTSPKEFADCTESAQKLPKIFWVFWMCIYWKYVVLSRLLFL